MTVAAIIFVIFLLAVAGGTFFVMKKAVKMAIRAAIVALILLIAVVGGISLWMFGTNSNNSDNHPAANKKVR
jgi:flagellar basal body-associated protein FliL